MDLIGKRFEIVVGAHFGDEGKGVTVDSIIKTYQEKYSNVNPIVIRFNGGHQAGHKVHISEDKYHIASSYGASTIRGVPTFISSNCLVSLSHLKKEMDFLLDNDIFREIYVDPMAIITSPLDIAYNQMDYENRKHGTVGRGIGATMTRHFKYFIKINAVDILHKKSLMGKHMSVFEYYMSKLDQELSVLDEFQKLTIPYVADEDYFFANYLKYLKLKPFSSILNDYNLFVFEGAQGTLLDMDHGIFPNVTYSNTTCKNAINMIPSEWHHNIGFNLVTRSYLTRHGNGPFIDEYDFKSDNPDFRKYDFGNEPNDYQGAMRFGKLDPDLLAYSLNINEIYLQNLNVTRRLIINCTDEVSDFVVKVPDQYEIITRDSPISNVLW